MNMSGTKIEEIVCEDKISSLPDDLLVTILLHLPIKDAVATMTLSKRWRFVWTMLPMLEYDDAGSFFYYHKSKKSIWRFFEKSMELHKAPVLEILLIELGPACPVDADVGKCLIKAVDRGLVVLELKLCLSTGPTRLPKSLYSCETLYQLTLSHKILVDFPSSSCLPSLFYLELVYVVYKDEASLVRFLSSCPVLGMLRVMRNSMNHDNVTKFSVKVPSLQYFSCRNLKYTSFLAGDDVVDTGRCLVIDTPALIDLVINDNSRDTWSIENSPCLKTAQLEVEYFPDTDKSKTSLSGVSSLFLYMTDEVLARCSTVNFSQLIKLEICPYEPYSLESLLRLLKNAPKLKDLLGNLVSTHLSISLTWNQPSSIPGCISSHLEIFEYKDYGDREEEEEFLTYILANSRCLKTVTISVKFGFSLEKKELIIEKLRNIPRVSTTSQLVIRKVF